MEFRRAVRDFLEKARAHLKHSPDASSVSTAVQLAVIPVSSVESSTRKLVQDSLQIRGQRLGHFRRRAEKEIILARVGKSGYFKVCPSDEEKVVFNVWVSPKDDRGQYWYLDRRGNPVRRLFPKAYYRGGEVVERISGKGPHLPIGILYGMPVDPLRFPPEDREILERFAEAITRGIARYDAERKERMSRSRQQEG